MLPLPAAAEPLLLALTDPLTQATGQRLLLAIGAVLAVGRRTVTGVLPTAGGLAQSHLGAAAVVTSGHRNASSQPIF
jgi:hypothetical protein